MKSKKNRILLTLLMLFVALMCLGRTTEAATYRQIAYVNSSDKSLVLKFKEFCSNGYSWTIATDAGLIMSGGAQGGTVGADRMLKMSLGSNYAPKTKYYFTVAANDKSKNSIEADYYTGVSLKSAKISQSKTGGMTSTATLDKGYLCKGEFLVFQGTDSTDLLGSVGMKKGKTAKGKATLVGTLSASGLTSGDYKTYTIMSYTIDGKTFYGQGIANTYRLLKKQYKVKGVKLYTADNKVAINWNASPNASYYKVYQSTKKNGSYKCIASRVYGTSYCTGTLTNHKTYYYKVQAIGAVGTKTVAGAKSAAKGIKIAITPVKVKDPRFAYDMDEKLILRWDKSANANGYYVYCKATNASAWTCLGSTSERTMSLAALDGNTTYEIKVMSYYKSGKNVTTAKNYSKTLTIQPNSYMAANRALLLANGVRTIEHVSATYSVYTSRHYTNERKLAFVNMGGYSSSTDYLIWINHYTQQVTIYKGSKGNWSMIRTMDTATGTYTDPSPQGVFKTTYKETGWYYTSTKELYVTHWCGRNSFHTRPLWNDGSVCTATIGKPASHGCARLYNDDAKFIYDNIPSGTTVISY